MNTLYNHLICDPPSAKSIQSLHPRYIPAFLLSLLLVAGAFAQPANYIKGKVVHEKTGLPIANASVFITNTSKGTICNAAGEFELMNVPVGTYDLIVSCVGYETLVYTYHASQLPLQLMLQIHPKAQELPTVVVEPFEKDGWKKWGKFFTENFIGTSAFAERCTIKNYKTLRFRFSKTQNKIFVIAVEPLMIENKALGYKIQYQLEEFSYSFKDRVLVYLGYTLFDELKDDGPRKKQLENRVAAYNGSIAHFMKSLYHNRLTEEGFEVRRLVKTPNLEKERVKKIYSLSIISKREEVNGKIRQVITGVNAGAANKNDSADYYNRVMHQPDMLDEYGRYLLTADSFVTRVDSTHKSIFFNDYLYVVYKKENEEREYLQRMYQTRAPDYQRSVVFLPNSTPLLVDATGNYSLPQDFMSYGYWAWSEKIAALLPLDYK